ERRGPELLTVLRVERSEAFVARRADEYQPARRDARARAARIADELLARRQGLVEAERRPPEDLARVRIDCEQAAPRRPRAGGARADRPIAFVELAGDRRSERAEGPDAIDARAVVRLLRADRLEAIGHVRIFVLHPTDERVVVRRGIEDAV